MYFSNSTYQMDLVQLNDNMFAFKIYTGTIIRNDIFEIRFDPEYMLSLYGLFDQLFINGVPFTVMFPITDTFNVYEISVEYDNPRDNAIITITHKNIYGSEARKYEIITDLEEEFLQILDAFDQYMYAYLSPEELEFVIEDLDSASIDLSYKIFDRQSKLQVDAAIYQKQCQMN